MTILYFTTQLCTCYKFRNQLSSYLQESKANIGLRNICYLVKKAENKWWKRLIKQEGKAPVFLKVDWDKWVDEDEDEEDKGCECF